MREGTDIVGTLNVVLSAQRIDTDAGAAKHAGDHRKIRHREHRGTSLAVLRDAETIINGGVGALGRTAARRGEFDRRERQ